MARPAEQRLREYKYRCAQSLVFGIPVVLLHHLGASLGGPEAPLWAGALQALLAGWVLYVAATGMLVEGMLRLKIRRRLSADLLVAFVAVGIYVYSLIALIQIFRSRAGSSPRLLFDVAVIVLFAWSALRWRQFAARGSNPGAVL